MRLVPLPSSSSVGPPTMVTLTSPDLALSSPVPLTRPWFATGHFFPTSTPFLKQGPLPGKPLSLPVLWDRPYFAMACHPTVCDHWGWALGVGSRLSRCGSSGSQGGLNPREAPWKDCM